MKLRVVAENTFDELRHYRRRKHEIRKFEDTRRKNIYSTVMLTKEQKDAIDDLYVTNYGEKIPYTWHRHFTAFTGNFDVNYFPELLYTPEFERYMNLWSQYESVFEDKNVIPILAEHIGIKMPKCIISCTCGLLKKGYDRVISEREAINLLNNYGKVFCKPSIGSSSGIGCMLADFQNGIDNISGLPIGEILHNLGNNFVIQERIICHRQISSIYDRSVNTFRIITYRWKNEFMFVPALMRIGRGGNYLDNAHAGGIFIAVDNDGSLHDTAFTEFKDQFTEHPDSHINFNRYRIDLFPSVLDAARKMHEAIPQIGSVNWDFTLNENGEPVLIEANITGGSIWLSEMSHGRGAFGENTAEILRWIRLMKKTPASERYKYAFGEGV